MQNNETSIFEATDEVIEGNAADNSASIEEITAGNPNEPKIIITPQTQTPDGESKPVAMITETLTNKDMESSDNTVSLWHYINDNCYQPFYSSFKGQFVAEVLQVTISIAPILMYSVIRKPYIPCQELPESVFTENKIKKAKKKTWKQRVLSLETLCILTLATIVFMAGLIDNDDANNRNRNNEFGDSRNRNGTSASKTGGFHRKYGAYY
eukprot:UN12337